MQWKCLLGLNKLLLNPFTSQEALPWGSCMVNNLIIGGPEKKHRWVHQIILIMLVCIFTRLLLSFYPHSRLSSWIFSWLTRNCESLPRWRHSATGPCSASRLTPCSPEKDDFFFKFQIGNHHHHCRLCCWYLVNHQWWSFFASDLISLKVRIFIYYKYWLFQLQWNYWISEN